MRSLRKYIILWTIVVFICIIWIITTNSKFIPILVIGFAFFNINQIVRTHREKTKMFDDHISFASKFKKCTPIKLDPFTLTDSKNIISLEKLNYHYENVKIFNLDLNTLKLTDKYSTIKFSEIKYFGIFTAETLRTKRFVIQVLYRTSKDLKGIMTYVCPKNCDIEKFTNFFIDLTSLILSRTNITVKIINK